jgi:hypothetical protein
MAEEEIEETLEIFDLSAEVDLTELDDEGLLFRESIIKTFYETATRTGKAVYGFTKDELQKMANEIVEEFRTRGRDYQVPLDRSGDECSIERLHGQELMSGEDDAPEAVKSIVNAKYKECRANWVAEHPEDENDDNRSNCNKIAWQAAIDAGWMQDNDGKWLLKKSEAKVGKSKSKTKDFFRFVADMEVRLRDYEFNTAMCEYCTYFYNMRCTVLEHIVSPVQVCDAYSGGYYMDDNDRKYVIENLSGFIKGLMSVQPLQKIFVRMLDAPVGMLLIFKDSMPSPHYFSITMNEFIEFTVSKSHWTQEEVNTISESGGMANE